MSEFWATEYTKIAGINLQGALPVAGTLLGGLAGSQLGDIMGTGVDPSVAASDLSGITEQAQLAALAEQAQEAANAQRAMLSLGGGAMGAGTGYLAGQALSNRAPMAGVAPAAAPMVVPTPAY